MEKKMKKNLIFILVGILLVVLIGVFYLLARTGKIKPFASVLVPTLSLSPSSGTHTLGQTFEVNILLDTAGKTVDGVDIYYLNYNPKALEVQDADSAIAGVQIRQGTLFPTYVGNTVDTANGRISISGIVSPGSTGFSGAGTFATVVFKVLAAAPTSAVTIDYTSGSTTDSNIVEHGTITDVLAAVINGSYNLTSPTPPPTVDLKANGKNGPITINQGKSATLTWTSTNATSCIATGGWSGEKPTSGTFTTQVLATAQNYILTCTGNQGTATDSVTVNIRISGGGRTR